MKVTKEQYFEILDDMHVAFEAVTEPEAGEEHRWYILYNQIVRYKPSGAYYQISFPKSTGDSEPEDIYGDELIELIEMTPYSEVVTKYRPVTA